MKFLLEKNNSERPILYKSPDPPTNGVVPNLKKLKVANITYF